MECWGGTIQPMMERASGGRMELDGGDGWEAEE
jgi:hypothetical protein